MPMILCCYAYGRKGCSQEKKRAKKNQRKHQMLESPIDALKQNGLNLKNKPND